MTSTNDKVLLNKATESPSGHSHPKSRHTPLPSELLREASGRLGWAGGIYAVGYTLAYWVPFFIQRTQHPGEDQLVQRVDAVPVGESRQPDRIEQRRLPDRRAAGVVTGDLELEPRAAG